MLRYTWRCQLELKVFYLKVLFWRVCPQLWLLHSPPVLYLAFWNPVIKIISFINHDSPSLPLTAPLLETHQLYHVHKDTGWFKVFRYSFFGTILNFLNRLLDSLPLVRSTWNLQYLLVLDWTLAWFTFCKNRYFHDNDKQKSSKTVNLKFCTIQISLQKANTSILNCGVWQTKYTRTKKFCMFVLK